MVKSYDIGDIVEHIDGSIYLVISGYTYTKILEGDLNSSDFDFLSRFDNDSLIFKYSNGVKNILLKSDYFCLKKLISKDCYELDNNITTFGISRDSVRKIDKISTLEIKDIVKNYYISRGVIKKSSRFEYLLPKEIKKATHSANIKSNGLEDYYFERLLKIYWHLDSYFYYELAYANIIGYLEDEKAYLIGDTNSPMYLTDFFTDNSGKKPQSLDKELTKRVKYKNKFI